MSFLGSGTDNLALVGLVFGLLGGLKTSPFLTLLDITILEHDVKTFRDTTGHNWTLHEHYTNR